LRTLRTSSIAAIVERLTPLLHLDPVERLPPDVTSIIFSYLSPDILIEASRVSKAWRERTLDSLLWKEKFRREGWVLDMNEVVRFEQTHRKQPTLRKTLSRKAASHEWQRGQKRRMQDNHLSTTIEVPPVLRNEDSLPDATVDSQSTNIDQEMRDVDSMAVSRAESSASGSPVDFPGEQNSVDPLAEGETLTIGYRISDSANTI
jgi:F-box and WD-40 domain protein 1/11